MAYVVAAIWRAKEGQADTILRVIEKMTPLSRQEPGCVFYQAHRSPTDPNLFFLYEQYVDEAGYEAHMATPHFEQYVKGEAIPNLENDIRIYGEQICQELWISARGCHKGLWAHPQPISAYSLRCEQNGVGQATGNLGKFS